VEQNVSWSYTCRSGPALGGGISSRTGSLMSSFEKALRAPEVRPIWLGSGGFLRQLLTSLVGILAGLRRPRKRQRLAEEGV